MDRRGYLRSGLPPPSEAEEAYLSSVALDALRLFTEAAALYFLFVTAMVVITAPPSVALGLLLQKVLYLAIFVRAIWLLRRRLVPPQQLHRGLLFLLILCLSSSLISVVCGLPVRSEAYSVILLLGCAVVEFSYRWIALNWALIWATWALTAPPLASVGFTSQFSKLLGVQMVALAVIVLRRRFFLAHFQVLQKLEGALQESERVRASLDQQVDHRTRELRMSLEERETIRGEREKLREQLLQSQKMESLGRLAGGVAHDFNNLLTVITGNIELARSHALPEEVEELLGQAGVAAQRAGELTGQLLAFSRKQVMRLEAIAIQDTLQDAIALVERLIGEDIELEVDLACPEAVVEGDVSQLQQVFLNLVVNARDAMPFGGRLGVRLHRDASWVRLEISDTGEGIPQAVQDRIFEPFFTTKPVGEGTGLGLSTVLGVVSKHRGKVSFTSSPEQGTTFLVELPVASQEARARLQQEEAQAESPPEHGSARLLLVEDDDQVRRLALRALEGGGFEVAAYSDALSALSALQPEERFDLLITDVVMPGMDGGKLAQEMRRRQPNLPVLFMSGYTDDRLSSFALTQQSDWVVLNKPFVPRQLRAAVADALRREVTQRPTPRPSGAVEV